ncbi:hypothetical protein A0J61_03538 [Choanephora cucurbitarum]|uniref:Uncharacterized protein n=1 Tax=Choanephora cucurbitarum TaxID=101091 RepID=A0A1C7NH39_9FUNG|nr:hypothetical protein A0J61_03538 [Choanephora cucurbitarum]
MRLIQDTVVQRYNQENDVAAVKAAKNNPGYPKFNSDRCKLFCESKVVNDSQLLGNFNPDTRFSIQVCGL